MFNNTQVLVAGGTGMIGTPLVRMLIERGARVRIASLDDPSRAHPDAEFVRADLTSVDAARDVCRGCKIVFNLTGVKGSPAVTIRKPASFFVPTTLLNTCIMEGARRAGVERFLFTSSIGVYAPAEIFFEDDVWSTFPSPNDRFAGWAKRMGELQAEAYRTEYGWDRIAIVRPANVYGPLDNFSGENAMVIPSLVRRATSGEDPFVVWGDGSAVRDFIYADDVARGMLLAMERMPPQPINLGSGVGVSIREVVETIAGVLDLKAKVVWDTTKPAGDRKRLMDTARARAIGFAPQVSLQEGIRRTIEWYQKQAASTGMRYDVFDAPAQ